MVSNEPLPRPPPAERVRTREIPPTPPMEEGRSNLPLSLISVFNYEINYF